MSRHEKGVHVPIRSSVFRLTNRNTTAHKSWHRKDSSVTLRKFALTNVYKYKKVDVANSLDVTPIANTHPSLPVPQLTLKANVAQPSNPKPLTFINSNAKEKERACTNIHVNPLFASARSHEKSLKSWEKLPYKPSACVPSSSKADVKSSEDNLYYSRPSIAITSSVNNASAPGGEASTRVCTTQCLSTNQDAVENRPSIHVNPSVLASSSAKIHSDILKRSNIVNFCETLGTLHNLPNNKLVPTLGHCTSSVTPAAVEPQRLVHVNPAILASKVAAKQPINAKTSVHVNPQVYARLKSEVRKEKPRLQGLTTPTNKSRLLTSDSNNKSLITLSRTKLVRGGFVRNRKLSFRRSQQSIYSTPKVKKVISRTPPSAVVKVAKSVCSKYKFIRKSSQSMPTGMSPGAINKGFSFVRTTYKLDRRLKKTPKPLKKVKTYSVRYDNSKRNNTESNLQGIMVHKRLSSSRSLPRGSRVWKNPGSLEPKKVVITNRKLFRIGNSPNVKTKRNKISTHKTLVRLGGVLYKTSRMKLTRTRTPKSKSLGCKVESKPTLFRKPNNRNRILHVRGDKFLMDRAGKTLKRISNKPEGSGALKRIDIGGVTFIQKSKNVLIRTNTHNARNVLSQAKSKSIALLTMRMQKNNTHCRFYRRLGRCIGKEKGRCPCIHDPKYISICKKLLLKGECTADGCLLSHELIPEKMPICKFFMQGCCSRDVCSYLHVRSDPDASICVSFLQGYCAEGSNCRKRHLYVCPQFDKTGKCPKSKYCPYPHKLRENLTINLEHMHRCAGDIPEVNSNRVEPKPDEFRYFHLKTSAKTSDLDVVSRVGSEEEETGGLLLKGKGKGGEEVEIDLSLAEEVVNRRRLFDDFFNLVHSDLKEIDDTSWNNIEGKMRVKQDGQELEFEEKIQLQVRTDRETEFQMTFVDRVLRQTRSDFMPIEDDKWKKIEDIQRIARKHREEIGRLLLERAKDRQLQSKVSNDKNTEGVDGFQLVPASWINYILRQCEGVRVQLEALDLNTIDADGEGDSQEMYSSTILSTLMLISKVNQVLWKLVNTPGNNITNTGNRIEEDNRKYMVSSSLVKLLQNLLSTLETKQLLKGNDTHLPSNISHVMSGETISSCIYHLQDNGGENSIQNEITSNSKSECSLDIFPDEECEDTPNFLSGRPRIGIIPTYIPLN